MEGKDPFAVQAAKASWMAPIVAFFLGGIVRPILIGNKTLEPEMARNISMVCAALAILIVVAGLVFGLIALFGIATHGTKRILIPSIIGIVLCSGWLFLLFTAVQAARRAAELHGQVSP